MALETAKAMQRSRMNNSVIYGLDMMMGVLSEFSKEIRKALAKKINMKFLPKVFFVGDKSFDYAEKIEKLIRENK